MYSQKYQQNFLIARRIGNKYKCTLVHNCLVSGFEDEERAYTEKGQAGNASKLDTNLHRAKRIVNEYSLCNPWEYFVTLTLDKAKYDRNDLGKFKKDLSQYIRDFRKKYKVAFSYLLIPEKHKDGTWHMHGFFNGLPIEQLHEFTLDEKLPYAIRDRIKNGKRVFTWKAYEAKFGFSDIELIENQEASANYILKYITKDALRTISELNAHMFYASNGLKRAEVVKKGIARETFDKPDYVGEYATIKWFTHPNEFQRYFEDFSDIAKAVHIDNN